MSPPSESSSSGNGGEEPKKYPSVSRPEKAVTMAAVARIVGLSQGAISSLLNDRDYGIRVSLKNREKVFKICRDLGYEPNDLRALVRIYPELGETCLLVSDRIHGGIANPFVGRLTAALMAHIRRQPASIAVILYSETHDYSADATMPGPLKHGTASKILCVGAANEAICRVVHERSLPAIMLGHTAHMPGVTSIVPDYPAAARLALGLLHGHGHRHIGIVSGPFGSHDPRLAEMNVAIGDAAGQLGLSIAAEDIFGGDLNFEAGIVAVKHMRERAKAPTALVCLAESAAAGVIVGAQAHGMWVPDQLSVVTFADHDGMIDSTIPMTAVVVPVDEIASVAVRETDRQIREGLPAGGAKMTVGVRLIERGTCGPVAK